ncbi:hypothetical protein NCC49_004108 [Naganishia albida]|nr:hypothetical protein NCC49_004108 [Naganishia albida]
MPTINWHQLPLATPLARSSQSLVVVGSKAYLFGGENVPRTPVDDVLYIIDLNDGSVTTSSSKIRPSPRVGSYLTHSDDSLYLWGGRESKEMTPSDASLWVYDIPSDEWKQLSSKGDVPEERSYHCMAVSGNDLYLHAGCPAKGRLESLHSLNLATLQWQARAPAPAPGRGGTVLCPVVTLPRTTTGKHVILRYGGFAGRELASFDVYTVESDSWSSVDLSTTSSGQPEARSVHALVPYASPTDPSIVAVMMFGERDPAPVELGHNGAGKFHDDVWAVRYENEGFKFERLEQNGDLPEARGWFGSDVWVDGKTIKVVVQGGLNGKNERLGDLWIGEVV